MKKLVIIPVLIVMVTSCELIKKAAEIEFLSNSKYGFVIDLGEDNSEINEEEVIDLTDDDEFEKYRDNLEEIMLDSVLISIQNYNGPDEVIMNGTLGYSGSNATEGTIFAQINNLNITDLSESGGTYKLNYDNSEVDKITKIMLDDKMIKVYLKGTASEVPVSFKFVVTFFTKVVAQPID